MSLVGMKLMGDYHVSGGMKLMGDYHVSGGDEAYR